MARAKRLLGLIDLLSQRSGYTAKQLSLSLGVSERTIFRDIKTLREEGAQIDVMEEGGFHIRRGWMFPPIRFSNDEIEAISLGLHWVSVHADIGLRHKAQRALAKFSSVLSVLDREKMLNSFLIIEPKENPELNVDIEALRRSIHSELKIEVEYQDIGQQYTKRVIWPFALAYYDEFSILIAWCEKRQDFRHFRTDRILKIKYLSQNYPNTKFNLHQLWLKKQLEQIKTVKN